MGIRDELDEAYKQMSQGADRIKELRALCKHPSTKECSDYLGEIWYKCLDCDAQSYYEDFCATW